MTFTLSNGVLTPDTAPILSDNGQMVDSGLSKVVAIPAADNTFEGYNGAVQAVNGQDLLLWDGEGAFVSAGAAAVAVLTGTGPGMAMLDPAALANNSNPAVELINHGSTDWLLGDSIAIADAGLSINSWQTGFLSTCMTFNYTPNGSGLAQVFTIDGPQIGPVYYPSFVQLPAVYDPLGESLSHQNPALPVTLTWDRSGAYVSTYPVYSGLDIVNDNASGLALLDPVEADDLGSNNVDWAVFDRNGSVTATRFIVPSSLTLFYAYRQYRFTLPYFALGNADPTSIQPLPSGYGSDSTPGSTAISTVSQNYSDVYSYDLNSNRASDTYTGTANGGNDLITYQYNGDDQLMNQTNAYTGSTTTTSFTYDNNGSQLTSTTGSNVTDYTYDVRNKMVGFSNGTTSATYIYDDDGNRVQETTGGTTSYYLTDDAQPIEQWSIPLASRSGSSVPVMTYIIGDRVLAQINSSAAVSYLLVDGHGSTRLMTNSSGTVTADFNYDAFGNLLNPPSGALPTVYLFGGDAIYDPVSELYMNGDSTRDRGAGQADFLQRDGIRVAPGNLANANLYVYVGGNPINADDPTGHAVYFVERPFAASYGSAAWLADSGHGYLLFTSTSDPGSSDPFASGQDIVDSFSFHPNVWDYGSDGAPGRVWEDNPADLNPSTYDAFLVTADAGDQEALLSYIENWIKYQPVGYDLGVPIKDPNDPNNQIGKEGHKDAPSDAIGYSLLSQNCVWWATSMLYQSGIDVPSNVAAEIASYNSFNGGGPSIVLGGRNPKEADPYGSTWFDIDQTIQSTINSEALELTALSLYL